MPPYVSRPSRVDVREALRATADAWRRAHVGEPPGAGEVACVFLCALWTERVDDAESGRELVAVRCG